MDHLGIDKFMVIGFCIGGPFIWSLLKRAPRPRALLDRFVGDKLETAIGETASGLN